MKRADHIICLDTHIDQRCIEFIHYFRPRNDRIYVQCNRTKKHIGEKAYFGNLDQMVLSIRQALSEDKNIVITLNDKSIGKKLAERCNFDSFGDKYRFYSSDCDGLQFNEDLQDINGSWSKLRVLMYTTTITVGIDFTVPHFHKLYTYARNNICVARDIQQQMGRVRILLDREVFVCCPEVICPQTPVTYDEVKKYILKKILYNNDQQKMHYYAVVSNRIMLDYILGVYQWMFKEDEIWSRLFFLHNLEMYRSKSFMNLIMEDILKNQGYIIEKCDIEVTKEVLREKIGLNKKISGKNRSEYLRAPKLLIHPY